jgi:hypothetical protein
MSEIYNREEIEKCREKNKGITNEIIKGRRAYIVYDKMSKCYRIHFLTKEDKEYLYNDIPFSKVELLHKKMDIIAIYSGIVSTMKNTPLKLAVFSDGKNIKVFQKCYFRRPREYPKDYKPIPSHINWSRNVNYEKLTLKEIEGAFAKYGFKKEKCYI